MSTINSTSAKIAGNTGVTNSSQSVTQQTPIGQTPNLVTSNAVVHQQQIQSQAHNTPNNQIAPPLKPPSLIPKAANHPNGILKPPLPANSKSHVVPPNHLYHPPVSDFQSQHLNIKYPPEVPKLASTRYHLSDPFNNKNIPPYRPPPPGRPNQIRLPPSAIQHHHPPLPPVPSSSIHRLTPHSTDSDHTITSTRLTANHLQQAQQQHGQEMLKFVRKADSDTSTTTSSNSGRLSVEQPTKHIQTLLSELRLLKEANQRLSDDNQELRDLCCFLDDDRQKGRKLAREWQRFGRYTASVMRQEVSAYQNKLRQLDDKQQELIRDNLELKELCLYLDEERTNSARNTLCSSCGGSVNTSNVPLRDDGDGSSSGTNADETIPQMSSQFGRVLQDLSSARSALSDQTLQYVRSLENRIRELEDQQGKLNQSNNTDIGRPEAVVRALQVLEVREQLEREKIPSTDSTNDQLDDKEKALLREMCNVVWRKLEETPETPIM